MEEEVSLVEISQVLIKHWKLLFFLPLIAGVIAYAVSTYLIEPQYSSTSSLIVMPFTETAEGTGVVRHDIDSTRQVVHSCKELTLSLASIQRVIGDLNLPYTATELRNNISITVGDVTTITVRDRVPTRAHTIAEHVNVVFMEYLTESARLENILQLNPPQIPINPDSPRVYLNVAVALILGLMVGIALSFLFEHLDNTIKTSEHVQKFIGVPVLGVIPEFEEEGKR